mmetsp:Transcript_99735/g.171799  ORF Transcript_99735/g.171799 Transcript_99735/m.171799 type:complete len:266 (+) Transcript_99735:1179-1976(+)
MLARAPDGRGAGGVDCAHRQLSHREVAEECEEVVEGHPEEPVVGGDDPQALLQLGGPHLRLVRPVPLPLLSPEGVAELDQPVPPGGVGPARDLRKLQDGVRVTLDEAHGSQDRGLDLVLLTAALGPEEVTGLVPAHQVRPEAVDVEALVLPRQVDWEARRPSEVRQCILRMPAGDQLVRSIQLGVRLLHERHPCLVLGAPGRGNAVDPLRGAARVVPDGDMVVHEHRRQDPILVEADEVHPNGLHPLTRQQLLHQLRPFCHRREH